MKLLTSLFLLCLLGCTMLSGCQPYPDSEETLVGLRAEGVDFGVRHELKVADFKGDSKSLILIFNQPLQELDNEGEEAPFQPSLVPRVPVESVVREGAAGVRVNFAAPLPPARVYTATVPTGWRALTGAAMVRPQTVSWETRRPVLTRMSASVPLSDWVPGQPLAMHFNQVVDLESLSKHLTLEVSSSGEKLDSRQWSVQPDPESSQAVQLTLRDVPVGRRLKLRLAPGLESASGTLESLKEVEYEIGPPDALYCKSPTVQEVVAGSPPFLEFSAAVAEEHLKRYLSGVDWGATELTTSDGKRYEFRWPQGLPEERVEVDLLQGLQSEDGHRLKEGMHFTLNPPAAHPPKPLELLSYLTLPKASTVLELPTDKGTEVATWALSERQFFQLLQVDDRRWREGKKLPQELSKPSYRAKVEKSRTRTRFLPSKPLWLTQRAYGAFLVRITSKGKFERRFLVLRTDLNPALLSLNQRIAVQSKLSGVQVDVLDRGLKSLEVGRADEKGFCLLAGPWKTAPRLLKVSKGSQFQLLEIHELALDAAEVLPGLVWANGAVFESNSEMTFFGVWWGEGELGAVELLDRRGEKLLEQRSFQRAGRFFRGTVRVPDTPGRYSLTLPAKAAEKNAFHFTVTDHPVLAEHPSSLTLEKNEAGRYQGAYTWDGPGAHQLGLKAVLRARPARVDGWEKAMEGRPSEIPVKVESSPTLGGGTFLVDTLPSVHGGWSLDLELHDTRDEQRVFRRTTTLVGEDDLNLLGVEQRLDSSGNLLAKFRFRLARDEAREVSCELDYRGNDGWHVLQRGEPERAPDGSYDWPVPLQQGQTLRLTCRYSDAEGGRFSQSFRSRVPIFGSAWQPLEASEETVESGQEVALQWPESAAQGRLWVGTMIGDQLRALDYRARDSQGTLGTIVVPELTPGVSEVAVFAVGSERNLWLARLKVDKTALVAEGVTQLDGERELEEVEAGQTLALTLEGEEAERVVAWWDQQAGQNFSGRERSAWAGLLESLEHPLATIHGNLRGELVGPLSPGGPLSLKAPEEAGRFRLCVMWSSGRLLHFAEHDLEVLPSARWRAMVPAFVRTGDLFSAGVRFWSDPAAVAPTGATTSVELDSELLPTTYYSTAALVEPGEFGDMLFSYRTPGSFWEDQGFRLRWELGVEGEAWPVEVTLKPKSLEGSEEPYRSRFLGKGALRFNLADTQLWKVGFQARAGQAENDQPESQLELEAERLGTMEVNLDAEHPLRRLCLSGGETLQVRHLTGSPVQVEVHKVLPRMDFRRLASSAYLLTKIGNEDGTPLDKAGEVKLDQDFLLSAHLVVAREGRLGRLRVPLPGGVEPLGCWLGGSEETEPLAWEAKETEIVVSLPDLVPGEYSIQISLGATVPGDFAWPAAALISAEGETIARARSTRLTIVER